jgi:hypothetical protein
MTRRRRRIQKKMPGPQKGQIQHRSTLFSANRKFLAQAVIANNNALQQSKSDLFTRLKGKEFWDWNEGENHKTRYDDDNDGKPACCFNCIIGWPVKHGRRHPIYDYERTVFDALEARSNKNIDKHVWIKKAAGLGITEFVLRFMVWLATRDDSLKRSHMCIVTGPNFALATDLIQRVRHLFVEHLDVSFETDSSYKVSINDVIFQAYPSNHLESMRGIDFTSVIFSDEAGFFGVHEQEKENPRTTTERYIGKSDPYLIMCSTPNLEDDMFGSIEFEQNPVYRRVFLHYELGIGKIYSDEDIARAKMTPSFDREYGLKYLGAFGDLFKPEMIAIAEKQGLECESVVKGEIRQDTVKMMGVDAGYGSSAFGIVVTQLNEQNGRIEVLYAEEFERPDFNDMIDHIMKLKINYNIAKIFVDAANVPVITSLKKILKERTDYDVVLQKIKHKHPPDPARWMDVIPVAFNPEGREMLIAVYMMLGAHWLAIHPKFDKLLISLRTAKSREGQLLKSETAHDDVLDALRLALKYYSLPENT